ncbi:MAG: amino acid permease, partial [Cyanobacteria bacterium HKST-UBA01]|nr:amino acid permease [Cyanobacteria bacterium HKST-UBA01]
MKDLLSKAIRRSSIANLQNQEEHGPKLSRVLSAWDLFVAGFGCIIGAGIFVLTGVAAAQHAGPGIIISFALAGALCALVAMAYAELASMIPVAGSAYTYARASLGELISMLIGWDLILEYNVGASGVAVGWSGYLQAILKEAGISLPAALSHAPSSIPWGSLLLTILLVGGAFFSFRRAYQLRFA